MVRTLQDRELVDVVGRGEGLGRPLLYGTTNKFLEHFGFSKIEDLPRKDDLPVVLKGENITEAMPENTEVGSSQKNQTSSNKNRETENDLPVSPSLAD